MGGVSVYRSNAGAEIDLLLTWPNGEHWAIDRQKNYSKIMQKPE
jgi:hypothetical protein